MIDINYPLILIASSKEKTLPNCFYISSAGLLSVIKMSSKPPMMPEKVSVYAASRTPVNYSYSTVAGVAKSTIS